MCVCCMHAFVCVQTQEVRGASVNSSVSVALDFVEFAMGVPDAAHFAVPSYCPTAPHTPAPGGSVSARRALSIMSGERKWICG